MSKILELTTVHPYPDTRIHHKYAKNFGKIFKTYSTGVSAEKTKGLSKFIRIDSHKSRLKRVISGNIVAIKLILKIRPTFCHIHDPELLPILFFCKIVKIKTIYDAHESLTQQIKQKEWIKFIPNAILENLAKIILWIIEINSNIIISATPRIEKDFTTSKKLFIVPNFPEKSEYKANLQILTNQTSSEERDEHIINICYVGSHLSESRGAEIILKITDELIKNKTKIKIHIAANIEDKYEKIYANKREIVIYPRLSRESVFNLMASCDIGLLLEDYSPNHMDAYPIKLFEYASLGLNIITTNIPLWKSIIEDDLNTGKAFDFYDWQSISEYISEFKRIEKKRRCEVSLLCQKKYSSDEYVKKISEVLVSI